jgi:pyruvate-formate lyase-activating enzyme
VLRESKRIQNFSGGIMASSGDLIRMMNYVDDIATTLRRIVVGSGFMSPEERKKLAEYMRNSDPNFTKMVETLDK